MIFIVHVSCSARGQIHGVVTHAQTGRKERFSGAAHLGNLIAAMAGPQPDGAKTALEGPEEDAR